MERFIPKINETFTNNVGEHFDNVREIRYEKGKFFNSFGELIGNSSNASDNSDGISVYRSFIDSSKAYRIHREQLFSDYFAYKDEYFISKLRQYGKNIKLVDFPTGVVTIEGRVIGQEVPFIEGVTLKEFAENNKNEILPTKLYIQVLNIIKELYVNKIYYLDIHERNFMINDEIIKLIDFEEQFVKLGEVSISDKRLMFDYLKMMINELNTKFNITDKIGIIDGIDDAYEKVLKLEEKLIREGYKNNK